MIIEVEGLRKSFGTVEALRGIDFTVPEGKVLGLLGPNGAGKTTAVRILTTLLVPTSGRARVAGFDVAHHPGAVRRVIGLAGQATAITPDLTGFENLEMAGRLYHLGRQTSRQRAGELLERFDLADAGGRQAKTYSGGMLRRLDLAASLIGRPRVLFLDEPTTGLDPRSRLGMWAIIRELVAAGTTLLLTTQYMDEADELADDIVVIDRGLVIASGTSEVLKDRIGGDVVEFSVTDRSQLRRRRGHRGEPGRRFAGGGRPKRAGSRSEPGARVLRCWSKRSGASTPPACTRRGWRCAGPRSTTCSCRSPGTWPRTRWRRPAPGAGAPTRGAGRATTGQGVGADVVTRRYRDTA